MHETGLSPTSERDITLLRLGSLLRTRGYRFITPTPLTHQRVNARPGAQLAQDLRDVFGWSRPFPLRLLDTELTAAMQAAQVLEPAGDAWLSRVRWSSLCEQLLVHSRFPTEQADAVFFGPDTYRFVRLLQAHLAHSRQPVRRIADIGCGSGAAAIQAALARPTCSTRCNAPIAMAVADMAARCPWRSSIRPLNVWPPAAPCCCTPAWRSSRAKIRCSMPSRCRCAMVIGRGITRRSIRTYSAKSCSMRPTPMSSVSPAWHCA